MTNKTPILFVVRDLRIGGAERFVINMMNSWSSSNYTLSLAILVQEEGEQTDLIPDHIAVHRNLHNKNSPLSVFWMRSVMRQHALTFSFVLRADQTCGIASALGAGKWVVTERGGRITRLDSGFKKALKASVDKLALKFAYAGVANSRAGVKALESNGLHGKPLFAIPNGIVPYERKVRESLPGFVVGFAGRLVDVKGVDTLIKAFELFHSRHPNTELRIAGDGPIRSDLEALVSGLGLTECVSFLGFQKIDQELLREWDVAVLPSRSESFPNVILEMWNYQVPIIVSNIPPILEVVEHGKNACTFEVDNPESLSGMLESVFSDEQSRFCLANEGRNEIDEKYSMEAVCRQYEHVFDELLED